MEYDDIVYVVVLIASIVFGFVFQNIENRENKKWLSTGLGLLVTLLVCGVHSAHSIILTFSLACLVKYHAISFAFGFTYLILFRCSQYVGIPAPTGHANMIQMIITLKLIGLAFEVRDNAIRTKKLKDGDELGDEDTYRQFINPTIIDVFHYTFCYVGVLTGKCLKKCLQSVDSI